MKEENKELNELEEIVSPAESEEEPEEISSVEKSEESAKFAEEVKGHYDELMKENAKAMEKAKKKKKLKKGQIALIIVASVILAIGVAVGLFFLIGTLMNKDVKILEVDFENTRPSYAVTFSASEQATIDLALQNNASEDQIKEAIALIYAKANENKIAADQAITVSRGQGSAAIGIKLLGKQITPDGSMIVRAFKVQAGDAFYYQKGAKIVDCSVPAATGIVSGILNQQERTYESGTGVYKTVQIKGSDAKIGKEDETRELPFLTIGAPKSVNTCDSREEFLEKGYYLNDPRELSNFRINKDTIVLGELEEGEKYISYDSVNKYYKMKFSLLISGEGHDDCVEIARQYLRDSSGSENLEYAKYDLIFEVWDNGYAKFMHDDEIWAGDMELAGAKSTTSSTTWYESVFYYDFDASLFTEADAAKYEGADWAKKIIDDYSASLN